MQSRIAAFVMLALLACSKPHPLDALQPGEKGRITRVFDGDAFVLDTGQTVRLVGIEAPAAPSRRRQGEEGHETAKRLLEDMALGREVQLYYGGLTRDRYDRALAHVRTTDKLGPDLWLNAEMIRRGGARLRVYADTAAANEHFIPLEKEAREAEAGLWREGVFRIRKASAIPAEHRGFEVIEGEIIDMQGTDEFGAVCELSLKGAALRLEIRREAAALCQAPRGRLMRFRGYVSRGRMEISHALNVQTLKEHP